jgi:hypothetical protein
MVHPLWELWLVFCLPLGVLGEGGESRRVGPTGVLVAPVNDRALGFQQTVKLFNRQQFVVHAAP